MADASIVESGNGRFHLFDHFHLRSQTIKD